MEGDREDLCGPEGVPSGRAARVARRERGQSGDAWRAPSCSAAAARAERRRARSRCRASDGRRPPTRWTSIRWPRSPPGCRRGGMRVRWTRRRPRWRSGGRRAARCLGGSWRCRPSACGRFLSRPLDELDLRVGLHRRQGLPGPLHGGRVGDRHAGPQARAGDCAKGPPRRRSSPAACSAIWLRAGLPTDRTLLFRHRRRAGAAPGHHRCLRFPRGGANGAKYTKLRNVLGHLPERLHSSVGKALRDAWDLESADRAARVLKRLAGSLERDHPGAAGVHPGGPR